MKNINVGIKLIASYIFIAAIAVAVGPYLTSALREVSERDIRNVSVVLFAFLFVCSILNVINVVRDIIAKMNQDAICEVNSEYRKSVGARRALPVCYETSPLSGSEVA